MNCDACKDIIPETFAVLLGKRTLCVECYLEIGFGEIAPPSSPGVGRNQPRQNDVPGRIENNVRSLEDNHDDYTHDIGPADHSNSGLLPQ